MFNKILRAGSSKLVVQTETVVQLKVVVEFAWRHELPDDVISDVIASCLVGGDDTLQQCDQLLL